MKTGETKSFSGYLLTVSTQTDMNSFVSDSVPVFQALSVHACNMASKYTVWFMFSIFFLTIHLQVFKE